MKSSLVPPFALLVACASALSPLNAQEKAAAPAIPAPAAAAAPAAAPVVPPAPVFKPMAGRIDLKDGDTFVFLGDSITHQCLYTQYVEDFYYTRYPAARIHFHNSGVGGDRAKDALNRFEDDVAAYKPKYVSILLGMNDGGYSNYQQPTFDTYMKGMNEVLDKIGELGAVAIPMTPTMHDARAARMGRGPQEPRDTFYNGVLGLYGAWLAEQSQVRGLGFVDMYSPLNALTLEQRRTDPNWTMIKDAVHPGATGQVVMATAVLNDMAARSQVSSIVIAEKDGKWTGNKGVSELQGGEAISFTHLAKSLPWVLPPEAAEGFKLAKAGHRFSVEKLTVRNLKPGSYELKIDGAPVGKWTDTQLSVGVELEENALTPQYQQALKVAMLNKQRNDTAMRPIRDQFGQLKGRRNNFMRAKESNDPQLEAKTAEFEKFQAEMKATLAILKAKSTELENQIYAANQPAPHKYELALVK